MDDVSASRNDSDLATGLIFALNKSGTPTDVSRPHQTEDDYSGKFIWPVHHYVSNTSLIPVLAGYL
jgi:hypothetical protein